MTAPVDAIEFLSPPGAITPTGPWSLGVRAGDFVFVAGMRGVDPKTNTLVAGDEATKAVISFEIAFQPR